MKVDFSLEELKHLNNVIGTVLYPECITDKVLLSIHNKIKEVIKVSKKDIVLVGKMVKVKSLGTAYFVSDGFLMGCPITSNNMIDKETEFQVEESPESDRILHLEVLKKLGVVSKDRELILSKIMYYNIIVGGKDD